MIRDHRRLRLIQLCLLLLIVGSSVGVARWWAGQRALTQLAGQADEQLQLRAQSLQRLIDRYRVLPDVLALDPELRQALSGPSSRIDAHALDLKLEQANGATHTSTLTLIDRNGIAVAANNWRETSSNVGLDYSFRPYFQEAMAQGRGTFYALGVSTNVAGYFIARALRDEHAQRIGVIVVKITLDALQSEWSHSDDTLLLSDAQDVVFLANRDGWAYRSLRPLAAAELARLVATRQYGNQRLLPVRYRLGQTLVDGSREVTLSDPVIPHGVLWRSLPLPAQRWTLHSLSSMQPVVAARRVATLATLGAWLPLILLGMFLQQRWRLARVRQQSREELERMVTHYTTALQSAQDGLVDAARQASQGRNSNLEHLPQGVSVVDAQLRLVAWNRRYAQIFGFPPELLQAGRPIEDLFRYNARRGLLGPGNLEEAIQRRLDYLRRGGPHMYEREYPDGSVLEIRGNPLPDGGFVTSYADITAYKSAARDLRTLTSTLEKRIEESTQDLRKAKADAERANRYKTRFVAAAVHDLMQPLNAARLFAGALRQHLSSDDQHQLLERVEQALHAQDGLLTSMLDISRLEAGVLQPTITSFALAPLLQSLARQFGIVAQERSLQLDLVDTRSWVRSDALLLRRILQNFLSNAMHYTPQGRVLLGCRRAGGMLRIEVWDTGVGIAENKRVAIFEEFHRLDSGLDRDDRSAGLGLSIVERIARLLGHDIGLQSWPGRGSVFSVAVPLAPAQRQPQSATPVRDDDSLLMGRHVWCIDDNQQAREGTVALLQSWGCRVTSMASEAEALAWRSPAPDIVLLDYQLGTSIGPDMLPALYQQWGSEPPVIVITAQRDEDTRQKIIQAGLHFMAKPVQPARLRALMSRLLLAASS
ncbi:NahK/ErcS family hybrid sensor histidine kinase/response regulator [Dyella sp.]|uniref:hybrid sensor histidine kinase/response regulator n=1 Tax=Dyella sp. TaxID=1869338 RepID=UPI002ED1C579